ncbi:MULTISPECIES: glycoside hydrolase family 3 protein [unclassified Streptomyces]|uniref:glycoside hydrolase family 3 protein n=1 Tax=unclassified Streptomyces TaxID=2593676 RepID=UPI001BB041B2|nr:MULTISPECIES: glycoside hydrolase family 3 protein [unclassified Streptomyces]MDH6453592.1 beta-N-acetylhexosaminidase [Streptomyces sp. SAI-119]MDH6495852.1 beta-N-acetylhexosaminidase [Streptomyces sp. SAI-149]QUC57267.1 glycoside hydrolase family 3 protein [Streptomyces sp. A2-16]
MTHTQRPSVRTALPVDLDEAAHRCLVAGFEGTTAVPDTLKRLIDRGLGGVILFTRNVRDAEQVRRLTDTLRALRPDLLVAIDNEGGGIGHLVAAGAPEVPGSYALGVVDDPALTARCADALAGHLATLGITASYAPVADVQRQADNPIVRTRAFGEETELVSRHLSAWIAATEARGIASCAKHFPGHGGTLTDSHHELAVDPRPYEELDLAPFRAAIAAGVPMLMSAHVVFTALDANRPATLSRRILGDLLRHELEFDGVLVSDALEMKAIADRYGEAAGARIALAAGADQVIVAVPDLGVTLECRDAVIEALREGVLAEERVREASRRVQRLVERYATPAAQVAPWDAGAGLEAARRAVRVPPVGVRGAHVVDLFPAPHPALNWGGEDLLTQVLAVDPTATGTAVAGEPADLDGVVEEILAKAGGAPLVVATCDAGLYPWQGRLRDALVARRPGAVQVATGLPDGGAMCSYGRGKVNLRAAAEVLVGAG